MNIKIVIGSILVVAVVLGIGAYIFFVKGSIGTASQKVYHVGVLNALDTFAATTDGFKQKMTELGYVEGVNIVYDVQKAKAPVGNQDILNTFVQNDVDLIFVFPTEATIEAKDATKDTSIPVISTGAYIESPGLIESVSHPGGNITGVRFPIAEIAARRLEILHQLAPNATRVLLPVFRNYPTVAPAMAAIAPIVEKYHLTVIEMPFSGPAEVVSYLEEHDKKGDVGFDAILVLPQPLAGIPALIDPIYAFANTHNLPIGGAIDPKSPQSLFNLIPDSFQMGELAAPLADKIFKGAYPGSIPMVTPELLLEINYKAVTRLGLTVEESLLNTAYKIDR